MPAWQDFMIAVDQGYHVFPSFPFASGSFYGDYPVLAATLYIGYQGCGRKTTCFLIHRLPDHELPHMDLMEMAVYFSELLDFELDAVTGWNLELHILGQG